MDFSCCSKLSLWTVSNTFDMFDMSRSNMVFSKSTDVTAFSASSLHANTCSVVFLPPWYAAYGTGILLLSLDLPIMQMASLCKIVSKTTGRKFPGGPLGFPGLGKGTKISKETTINDRGCYGQTSGSTWRVKVKVQGHGVKVFGDAKVKGQGRHAMTVICSFAPPVSYPVWIWLQFLTS